MLEPINGRTMYYGKGDVLAYRTYSKPLAVSPVPESGFLGNENVIFAHNIKFAVTGEAFLPSFSEGDNSMVVATDSMKNFILRQGASYEGSTTEGFLAFVSERFMNKYGHITAISIAGDRLPFDGVRVAAGGDGVQESGLVFRRSHNESASASLEIRRTAEGAAIVSHRCMLKDLQLIKVSGSSFHGFIRDEYTTLPDSYDRPLFIFLNIGWTYEQVRHAIDGDSGKYVAAEQIRDIAQTVFHEKNSPSIQWLICQIGIQILERFPQLAEVNFESNNRTWETIAENVGDSKGGVFTEPRPPYGFQGFSMTREDLNTGGKLG
ncbi:factor-independent urate hydroxylase [Paenibacillus alkalitolerans]|uniref:factor-independent urate hydroxylase n=1 Tax=Paenibacillus alkalitolerans TaxID=2799335 RepID=UPI0018F3866C|nr:urate oxidase [Paenibacillus alkalitolerans]